MIFFKINSNNRVYNFFQSNNYDEEDAILLTENMNPDNKNIMYSLYQDNTLIFDDVYNNFHNPPITEPNYNEPTVINEIQKRLDEKANSYNFDSMLSAASYVSSSVERFRVEAIALASWRDSVWAWAYKMQDDIQTGKIPAPLTLEEFLSTMPEFIPPAT